MKSSQYLGFLLVIGLLAVASTVGADQWYEHYARAEKALSDGDHGTAIAELNLAIERRGDSGSRVRTYGMRVTDYFPYMKLGIAYVMAGEPEAALRAFDTEEQLGAVQNSDEAIEELSRYRGEATVALEQRRAEQQRRVNELVDQNLGEARDHQLEGRIDEALAAVDRALALAPDDSDAVELASALRDEVVRRDEARVRNERVSQLIDEGQALRAGGRLGEAAASLRQALELAPDSRAGELLRQVQIELAGQSDEVSAVDPSDDLSRAEELFSRGDNDTALGLVQQVLAREPGNARAADLETRLLARMEQQHRSDEVDQLLEDARGRLADGAFEAAIASANLVLAWDRGNSEALRLVQHAYASLSRKLLGEGPAKNLPPAIRFADMVSSRPGGAPVRIVSDRLFRLSGVVIDETEVTFEATFSSGDSVATQLSSQVVGGVTITEFGLEAALPLGTTTIAVIATDDEGLSSRSEISVEYRRPILRSPWLWGAIVAIPMVVIATRWVRKSRRRAQLRRRRFNPFVAGPPVLDPELFVGRDALVDRVLATVPNNSLLLLGERRIGKTSTLQQLRVRLPELDHPRFCFVPVSVDLQGVPEEAFFATVAEAVGESVGDEKMSAARVADGYDSRELMRDLRRMLPTVQCPDGRRAKVVLLLDEIDELNGYSHRTNQRLRSLFMRSFADQLVAVAAGVGIAREWDHEGSPWYNFFEEIEVGPVDRAAARRLVTEPLAGVITIDDEAVDRLLEEAAGRPYILQKTALAVVQRVHENGLSRITLEDVKAVVPRGEETRGRV